MEQTQLHIIFYRCSSSRLIVPLLDSEWTYETAKDLRGLKSSDQHQQAQVCVLSSFQDEVFWDHFSETHPETPYFQVLDNENTLPIKSAVDVLFYHGSPHETQLRLRFGIQKFEHLRKVIDSRAMISKSQKIHQDMNDRLLKTSVELKEAKERIEELSLMDPLTKIKNRRFFQFQLPREIHQGQRYGTKLSMLLMDIDHFKSINDNYGHPYGDEVLVRLGELIMLCLRDTDWAARYGGEEFAIVLPMTGLNGALQTAERLRKKVEERLSNLPDKTFTVSIGVSRFREGLTQGELVKQADEALYKAKHNGRNCVYYFNNEQEDFCEFTSGATQ